MNVSSGSARTTELARWLDLLEGRHHAMIDLDLSRCGQVWQSLGAPRPAQHIVTVAGTNGKGSTVAWIGACLGVLGLKYGQYTSPHLLHFSERLRINGLECDEATLVEAFKEVEAARGTVSLTYFEFTTLACLLIMSRSSLDVAVLEVGLGGRLDTVNLIEADLAVITPIGLDHQAFLGDDLNSIGREKAGILRPGMPLIAAEPAPPDSLLEHARALNCPVLLAGRDFDITSMDAGVIRFSMDGWQLDVPQLQLSGAHQMQNLAGALAAVESLFPEAREHSKALAVALPGTHVPGRLQVFGSGPAYFIDVGHNPLAATAIAGVLAELPEVVCVLAMLNDKDVESVARILAPRVDVFVCAGLNEGARSQDALTLSRRVKTALQGHDVIAKSTVYEALDEATRLAGDHSSVLVFGSFHTAAEAFEWLSDKGY